MNQTFIVYNVLHKGAIQLEFLMNPKVQFKGETATLIPKVRTFFEAKSFCELNQATIYQPNNMKHYEIITKFASDNHVGAFWLGISDQSTKGNYLLLNGQQLPEEFSVFWAPGQPNKYIPFIL